MANSITLDNTRPSAESCSHAPQSPGAPSPDARENFEKAMSETREDGSSGNGGEDRDEGQGGQAMPSASSLLASLFEGKMGAVAAPEPVCGNLDELVDDLVQRILVSEPKSGAPAEIRLQLNDSVLPDTQIALQRSPDGSLSVMLTTGNASSMQTLVSAQQSLREQLEKHGPVEVRVNSAEESGREERDADRRSRGLMYYGPETL
ncbi:MAG: hypothetical protein LBU06_03265 [Desulfovibrio sp.]|nr:hypothetical protein [Desulfovibrio sp.]